MCGSRSWAPTDSDSIRTRRSPVSSTGRWPARTSRRCGRCSSPNRSDTPMPSATASRCRPARDAFLVPHSIADRCDTESPASRDASRRLSPRRCRAARSFSPSGCSGGFAPGGCPAGPDRRTSPPRSMLRIAATLKPRARSDAISCRSLTSRWLNQRYRPVRAGVISPEDSHARSVEGLTPANWAASDTRSLGVMGLTLPRRAPSLQALLRDLHLLGGLARRQCRERRARLPRPYPAPQVQEVPEDAEDLEVDRVLTGHVVDRGDGHVQHYDGGPADADPGERHQPPAEVEVLRARLRNRAPPR